VTGRFAPSTSGEAHPGTLLAALLAWLDARSRGGRIVLRLEDLDPARTRPAWAAAMVDALAWLGLDWDERTLQSERRAAHAAALDELAAAGVVYACACSRAARTRPAPDGGYAYDNTCRARVVADWRSCGEPLRVRLPDERIELVDDLGMDLSQHPAAEMGDPVVRRRDGAIAYQLAVVVDDAAAGVTDVVRGRDIASSTATQVLLQRLLGVATPRYRHHFLLLEPGRTTKLAKLHGSIPFAQLRERYGGDEICGVLCHAAGLVRCSDPVKPLALVDDFDWANVRPSDLVATWRDGLSFE
jgi:glutamyl-Q tRNA(Asp) synthetase